MAMLADRRGVASAAMPGPISLPGIIRRHAIDRPQNPALIIHAAKEIEPEEMSYSVLVAQMSKAQERIVQLLPDAGGDQQRVAILAHNSTSYLIHSLAVMELGAMAVHLNWRMPAATLGEQLGTLRCALLFATPALKEAGHAAAAFCSTRIHVELLTPPTPLDEADASAMKPAKIAAPASDAWSDTIAVVFFTSGSTGKPKAIPHTHGSLVWWATNYTAALPEVFDATVPRAHCGSLSFAPYFHVMGFVANTVLNLVQGAPAYVLAHPTKPLTARLLVEASLALQPRTINTVPVIVEGLCALLRGGDEATRTALSRVALLTYGGAALPSHCASTLRESGVNTACTYGQTETAGPIMLGARNGDLNALRPIGGTEVSFELAEQPGPEDESAGKAGMLILHGIGSVSRMRFDAVGQLLRIHSPTAPYETRDLFRAVDLTQPSAGRSNGSWLLYACRDDDVLVHTSGEMTNPHPTEDCVKSLCADDVARLCMVGNGQARPALLVELAADVDMPCAMGHLVAAVASANAQLAEYSKLRLGDVWVLQPPNAAPLTTSVKGNVVRAFAEARLAELLDGREDALNLAAFVPWTDLVNQDDGQGIDSMRLAANADESSALQHSRQAAIAGHAILLVMYAVVSVHYLIHEGHDRVLLQRPGAPHWLHLALRSPGHTWAMPLAFMLLAVTDSARLERHSGRSRRAAALGFLRGQILRPYVLLLLFKLVLTTSDARQWGLRSGAWDPMWFLFVVLAFRVVRFLTWLAGVPEAVVFAAAIAMHLISGVPNFWLAFLRRCLHDATRDGMQLAFANDTHGGRRVVKRALAPHVSWLLPQCQGPFTPAPSSWPWGWLLSHTAVPFWIGTDQVHMRFNEFWPYYCAGPWLLARALHSSKIAPHAQLRSWPARLFFAATLIAAIASVCHEAQRRELFGVGDGSECALLPSTTKNSTMVKFHKTWSPICCHDTSLAFTMSELAQGTFMPIICCTVFAITLSTVAGSAAVRLERATQAALCMLAVVTRLNAMPITPFSLESGLLRAALFDAAKFITTSSVCTSIVELMPSSPSIFSRVGLTGALPAYMLHVLVFPVFSSMQAKFYALPVISNKWLWPYVSAALIFAWLFVIAFAVSNVLQMVTLAFCSRVSCGLGLAERRLLDLRLEVRKVVLTIKGMRTLREAAIPLFRVVASLFLSVAVLAVASPSSSELHVSSVCPPPARSGDVLGDIQERPRVKKDMILVNGACTGANGKCPFPARSVATLKACGDLCANTVECMGFVYNTLGECYLHGNQKPLQWSKETWTGGTSWAGAKHALLPLDVGPTAFSLTAPNTLCSTVAGTLASRLPSRALRKVLGVAIGIQQPLGWNMWNSSSASAWRNTVMLTMATRGSLPLLPNLHCSLRHLHMRYVLAAFTQDVVSFGASRHVPTIDLSALGGNAFHGPHGVEPQEFSTPDSMCKKIALVHHVLSLGIDVLAIDADMVFVSNPLHVLSAQARLADVLIPTGTVTRGCLSMPSVSSEQAISFSGSEIACADNRRVWEASHLASACRAWKSTTEQARGATSTRPAEVGFIDSGFLWLRSRPATQRLMLKVMREIGNATVQREEHAMFKVMCAKHRWGDWRPDRLSNLRWGLIDSRVVTIAPVAMEMSLQQFVQRVSAGASPQLAATFCAGLSQLEGMPEKPYVLHNAWNEPVSTADKKLFLKHMASYAIDGTGTGTVCTTEAKDPRVAGLRRSQTRPCTVHDEGRCWARRYCRTQLSFRLESTSASRG